MKTKSLVLGLTVVAGGIVAAVILNRPQSSQKVESPKPARETQAVAVNTAPPISAVPATSPPEKAGNSPEPVAQAPVKPQKPTIQNQPAPQREVPDLNARAALSLVGVDPDAEQYWANAIFDPNRSDKEREDLMEDLNEEGFADPHNPGPEDLPMIVNRLLIIEAVAPDADEFMTKHLREAYKDLAEMYVSATQQ